MDKQQIAALLVQAEAAKKEHQFNEAAEGYDEVVDLIPAHSEDAGLAEMRLSALREQGELRRLLGDPEAALASYEQYYLEAGTSQHAVEALVLIGTQYTRMSQFSRALETFREALQLAQALNYTPGRAKAVQGIGGALQYMGRIEEGITNLRKALSLFEQLGDDSGQMHSWNWLGIAYLRQGAMDKAIDAFLSCLDEARQVGKRETAITLGNLGECYQNLFDMEQAQVYHEEALALAKEIQLRSAQPDLARNLGVDLLRLGRTDASLAYLRQALQISRDTGNPDVESQTLYALALAEIQRGELAQAYEYASELRQRAEANNARALLGDALHAIGLYHKEQGDALKAQQVWQEALFLAHETGRRVLLWQIHAALARLAAGTPLEMVHYRIAAEVIEQIAYPIEDDALREKFLSYPAVKEVLDKVAAGD